MCVCVCVCVCKFFNILCVKVLQNIGNTQCASGQKNSAYADDQKYQQHPISKCISGGECRCSTNFHAAIYAIDYLADAQWTNVASIECGELTTPTKKYHTKYTQGVKSDYFILKKSSVSFLWPIISVGAVVPCCRPMFRCVIASRRVVRHQARCIHRFDARCISSTINNITIEHEELGSEHAGRDVVFVSGFLGHSGAFHV